MLTFVLLSYLQRNVQKYSQTNNVYDFCPSGVKRSLANARQHLSEAENNFIDMARVIEKLPSQGSYYVQ